MQPGFVAIPSDHANQLWRGGFDAYGHLPERAVSDGNGIPCRHCLKMIAAGDEYLIFAYRPFTRLHPYAETGPVFIHASRCQRSGVEAQIPEILNSPSYILRGYGVDERIIYGTGRVVETGLITERAAQLLGNPSVAFVDVRSASNNCLHCRIVRTD